jgi:hypothetical protein
MLSCSTEKEQMQTVRDLAKQDLITQLQLPEGTSFDEKAIEVVESKDIEDLGATYVVTFNITYDDANGNKKVKQHVLKYVKINDGGLAPEDYELTSFD